MRDRQYIAAFTKRRIKPACEAAGRRRRARASKLVPQSRKGGSKLSHSRAPSTVCRVPDHPTRAADLRNGGPPYLVISNTKPLLLVPDCVVP